MTRRHLLVFILLLLLGSPLVHAISYMNLPSQREYVFQPGLKVDIPLFVGDGDNIGVDMSSQVVSNASTLGTPEDDNILNYVTLNDPAPNTGPRQVTVQIRLPQQMKPGIYPVDVIANDYAKDAGTGTITAMARVAVRFTIRVYSPDKLIEIRSFDAAPVAEGMDTNATIAFISRTTQDISRVYAEVRVYTGEGAPIVGTTETIPLLSGEGSQLVAQLKTEGLKGGDYAVNATLYYDGKSADSPQATLKIGTLHVGITDYSHELTYNITNRFNFTVSNQWNRGLQEVYANVAFKGQEKKTASQDIPPFGDTVYEIYFDRDESILPGPATVNVSVTFKDYNPTTGLYDEKTDSFPLDVEVVLPPAPEKQKLSISAQTVVFALLSVIIIVLVVLIIILATKRKQDPPAKTPPASPPAQPSQSSAQPSSSPPPPTAQNTQSGQGTAGNTARKP